MTSELLSIPTTLVDSDDCCQDGCSYEQVFAPSGIVSESADWVVFRYRCDADHIWTCGFAKRGNVRRTIGGIQCQECGRNLTDPLSVAAGHGPTCSRYRLADQHL